MTTEYPWSRCQHVDMRCITQYFLDSAVYVSLSSWPIYIYRQTACVSEHIIKNNDTLHNLSTYLTTVTKTEPTNTTTCPNLRSLVNVSPFSTT